MTKAKSHNSKTINHILENIPAKGVRKTERKMLLSARILDGLKQKGWKKRDLADVMNKNPSEVTKWLSGTHNFTVDTLEEIGFFLNIDFFSSETPKATKSIQTQI